MADACYALPDATIRVMGLPAMARITKVPEERLVELAASNPVFAPGPENYLRMGGVQEIWSGDLAARLEQGLGSAAGGDLRSVLGQSRGGRKFAQRVIDAILSDSDVLAP
jgi:malonate decarboxylase gamma subunit